MKSNPDGNFGITDGLDSLCGNGLSMRFIQHLDPLNEIRFIGNTWLPGCRSISLSLDVFKSPALEHLDERFSND